MRINCSLSSVGNIRDYVPWMVLFITDLHKDAKTQYIRWWCYWNGKIPTCKQITEENHNLFPVLKNIRSLQGFFYEISFTGWWRFLRVSTVIQTYAVYWIVLWLDETALRDSKPVFLFDPLEISDSVRCKRRYLQFKKSVIKITAVVQKLNTVLVYISSCIYVLWIWGVYKLAK